VPDLTISAVARRTGLRASALRYYERIGLLPPACRSHGQRRYDLGAVRRLLVIGRARAAGFSLAEIRRLITGFPDGASPADRWRALAPEPLARVRDMRLRLEARERLLVGSCRCGSLEECGERLETLECADAGGLTIAPRLAADLLNLERAGRPS
jgi:MerR family redox-sensitive transcriptional activator SoxR